MRSVAFPIFIILATAYLIGAAYSLPGMYNEPETLVSAQDCDPDTVYFKQDVLPLLRSNCAKSGCHNEETAKHGVILNSYENLMSTVEMENGQFDDKDDDREHRRGRGNGSDKYRNKLEKMIKRNKMPPAPEKKLSPEQRNVILKWIDQGMKNNSCEKPGSDCDLSDITFSKDIKPIIDDNCAGCHGGPKPKKGYDFTDPGKFREVALTGKVYLAITHAEGVTAMPFEGDKLSDCDISRIKAWIDAGAELK